MNLRKKWYLWFSIVYWVLIAIGLLLFALALEKVPINYYGLKRNYFNSQIDPEHYPSGFYHKDIGFYFLHFPSSKRYLEDLFVNATNKDMQTVGVTYTLVYRLFPEKIETLYSQMSQEYEPRIIAIVNSIISNYFTTLTQSQTRVSIQNQMSSQLQSQFGDKLPILKQCVQIQALWLNELNFYEGQNDYESSFQDASSYSETYQQINIDLQKTKLQVDTLQNLIVTTRKQLQITCQNQIIKGINSIVQESKTSAMKKKLIISEISNVSQIFQYYKPPKLLFKGFDLN